MSQERREQLRRFEQKMREQGADGFADGPRPWEHWDESGHQANNRIWEGSARRIYPGSRKVRSLGHRLLSVLAFIALTTLLVGIGGVYFSHTYTRQLSETGVEPLPFTDRNQPAATVADNAALTDGTATQTDELNVLSAPAAGAGAMQEQEETAVAIAAVDSDSSPDRDESAPRAVMAMPPLSTAETIPPETTGTIDSVAIETVVTEQSVTTTVYTRHPLQDEAEIVAAIETTTPPFAHKVVAAPQDMTAPATVSTSSDAADTPSAPEAQPGAETDHQPVEQSADATTVADTETDRETTDTGLLAAATAEATDEQPDAVPDSPPAKETEAITTVAVADMGSKTATTESSSAVEAEIETAVSDNQNDTLPDSSPAAQDEVASIDLAAADTVRATTARESPAEAAAEVIAVAEVETVTPVAPAAPVAKTGGWVINLSSYTRESTANRKLALFQQQGVDAEVFAVTINDKPMYRIRVTGYENSRSAKADIPAIEETLGLEGAWISRR